MTAWEKTVTRAVQDALDIYLSRWGGGTPPPLTDVWLPVWAGPDHLTITVVWNGEWIDLDGVPHPLPYAFQDPSIGYIWTPRVGAHEMLCSYEVPPAHLTRDQIEIYDVFRESGMYPAMAEEAALLIR